MTRAITPQPALQSGQMLGFQVAMPGTRSSSGMKRMTWCSGLAARRQRGGGAGDRGELDEMSAVHQRDLNSDKSGNRSTPALFMAVHAEPHVHVHRAARHRLFDLAAVAIRALDLGANVRRMLEPHVRLRESSCRRGSS
jgi:hypothetical protein